MHLAVRVAVYLSRVAGGQITVRALAVFLGAALAHHTEVVRGAGRLKLERRLGLLHVVQPVEDALVVPGADHLVLGDLDPAANRHQQE